MNRAADIPYTIKNSKRARRVRLAVYCDGTVVVTAPVGLQTSIIEKFIRDKTKWLTEKLNFFKSIDGAKIRVFSKRDYARHKEEALQLVQERVQHFNKIYGFAFNKVSVRNQKTRWGSCSRKKNLSFNYKVLFLSERERDYIVVHELCHLKEFNHSRRFWQLVAIAVPNYREIKKQLRKQEVYFR